jgi:hypothetical protein
VNINELASFQSSQGFDQLKVDKLLKKGPATWRLFADESYCHVPGEGGIV